MWPFKSKTRKRLEQEQKRIKRLKRIVEYWYRTGKNKVNAIKRIREETDWGLKKAKSFVDHTWKELDNIYGEFEFVPEEQTTPATVGELIKQHMNDSH